MDGKAAGVGIGVREHFFRLAGKRKIRASTTAGLYMGANVDAGPSAALDRTAKGAVRKEIRMGARPQDFPAA